MKEVNDNTINTGNNLFTMKSMTWQQYASRTGDILIIKKGEHMKIRAVEIKEFDFTEYGIYYNMLEDQHNILHSKTDLYEDHMTCFPLIDTPGHLGYTIAQSAPYVLKSMEKHDHTMEALFCTADPIIVCFAKSHGETPPQAEDVRAVILRKR